MEEIIKQIEKEENIKVLFLLESGSRAWGFESEDSDYDIRGVFIQDYQRFDKMSEQIDRVIGEKDITLWDLRKFLRLMIKSNPSVWEWLSSNIIYTDHPLRKTLRYMFEREFSKYALQKHYISMARQNFQKYINGIGDKANLKKYIYILRSLACANYIEKNGLPPPKNYKKTIELLPKNIQEFFEKIVEEKKKSESMEGARNPEAEKFIQTFFDMEIKENESSFDIDYINRLFKETINAKDE